MAALAVALVLASCGEQDMSSAPADTGGIELTVRFDPGEHRASTGGLSCQPGEQRVTGALAGRAPATRLCDDARVLAAFLKAKKPDRRACTQIYGGPQTARITGTVHGRDVDRVFTRTNGCEIEDYAQIAKLLPR